MAQQAEMTRYADFQKYNFFRKPNWRWQRVAAMCDRAPTPGRCTRFDDDYVRQARSFLLRYRAADPDDNREQLFFENPGLFYAYQFFAETAHDPDTAMYMEARLLAGQSNEEIAETLSTLPQMVEWYEALFFNVSDRLKNRDWITRQILIPAMVKQTSLPKKNKEQAVIFKDTTVARPFLDGSLKLFAYFGGKLLVDALIACLQAGRPVTSVDDVGAWWDAAFSTTIRRRSTQAAMLFEVNGFNATELFMVHTRIMEIERSDEGSEQQKSSIERHISALMEELPFAHGDAGERMYAGTTLGEYDDKAAELRDNEVLMIAANREVATTGSDNFPDRIPPPRKKNAGLVQAKTSEL